VNVLPGRLPGLMILEPRVFEDHRGFFLESYNRRTFATATGIDPEFVQDNHSSSGRGVLRGLHYQIRDPQGKLVRVTAGEVFDVAVDLRRSSPAFGRWDGVCLSAASRRMLWIPPGFAHGFLVLSDRAEVQYKTTAFYAPKHERTLLWSDPRLAIAWPLEGLPGGEPVLADKDRSGSSFAQAEVYP
jgi:dTDP-4-dehydrorhamnose 3,5-epimerase